ncbi:unnamed protein product, partial [marine sediment metagenome]
TSIMKQAHQHLSEGNTYYDFINNQINAVVERWNSSHTRQTDPKIIGEAFKKIFEYHKWIQIDDIKPSIDLGLMGQFGENKGLNSESIFKWFTGYSNYTRKNELQNHTAYKSGATYISTEQRKETRVNLIKIFMEFYNDYKETQVISPNLNHYIPVFYRWFKRLKYIELTDKQDVKVAEYEAKLLRNARTVFSTKPDSKESRTIKSIFYDAFKLAADNNYPIKDQLTNMNL